VRSEWSCSAFIESLQTVVFLERASAHILAGCLPRIRGFATKLAVSHHLYEGMAQAYRMRDVLLGLDYRSSGLLLASSDDVHLMKSVDGLLGVERVLAVIYLGVKPRLADEYRWLFSHVDSLLDSQLLSALTSYLPQIETHAQWGTKTLTRYASAPGVIEHVTRITERWRSAISGRQLPLDQVMWTPLSRAPAALRPRSLKRGDNGALPIMPRDTLRDPQGIGIFLHNSINEEYTTLELMGRNSYEHPDMPWAFHLSLARQVADEARHAQILERLADDVNVRYGDHPIYVTNYDMLYSYDHCEPGSKRELLWRLLLRSTYQEALSLDFLAFEIKKREFLHQPKMARAFCYILADELFHVESGIRWSRAIAESHGFDVLTERRDAREYYLARESHERLRFIARYPERFVAEMKRRQEPRKASELPFGIQFESDLRRRAGFSDADLEQAQRWDVYS